MDLLISRRRGPSVTPQDARVDSKARQLKQDVTPDRARERLNVVNILVHELGLNHGIGIEFGSRVVAEVNFPAKWIKVSHICVSLCVSVRSLVLWSPASLLPPV